MKTQTPGTTWFTEEFEPRLHKATSSIRSELNTDVTCTFSHSSVAEVAVAGHTDSGDWTLKGEFRLCEDSSGRVGIHSHVTFTMPGEDEPLQGDLSTQDNRELTPSQLAEVIAHDFALLAQLIAIGDKTRALRECE